MQSQSKVIFERYIAPVLAIAFLFVIVYYFDLHTIWALGYILLLKVAYELKAYKVVTRRANQYNHNFQLPYKVSTFNWMWYFVIGFSAYLTFLDRSQSLVFIAPVLSIPNISGYLYILQKSAIPHLMITEDKLLLNERYTSERKLVDLYAIEYSFLNMSINIEFAEDYSVQFPYRRYDRETACMFLSELIKHAEGDVKIGTGIVKMMKLCGQDPYLLNPDVHLIEVE